MLLLLTACGQKGAPAQTSDSAGAQLANPWREVTEAEAKALYPQSFTVPDRAGNAVWYVMESAGAPALLELDFELDGLRFTARQQQTGNRDANLSGMFYTWTAQLGMTLRSGLTGTMYRWIDDDGYADLCVWYDETSGVSYSLGVTAKDLDGFDLQAVAEALFPQAEPVRQDGERFEGAIILEGMEETVRYEHVRNDALGFEVDYDYENFVHRREADREIFVSCWDDPQKPENYLELRYNPQDAGTVAANICAYLSGDYEVRRDDTFELEQAGSCIRIDADEVKGGGYMPEQLQTVYVIPAGDGCRIVWERTYIVESEGFGRRFGYMMQTFSILPAQGEKKLTDGQAAAAVRNCCLIQNPELAETVKNGEYPSYWEAQSSDGKEIVVLFRSYTGAQIRYYIDPVSGETTATEFVPGVTNKEQQTGERLNAWDYLF